MMDLTLSIKVEQDETEFGEGNYGDSLLSKDGIRSPKDDEIKKEFVEVGILASDPVHFNNNIFDDEEAETSADCFEDSEKQNKMVAIKEDDDCQYEVNDGETGDLHSFAEEINNAQIDVSNTKKARWLCNQMVHPVTKEYEYNVVAEESSGNQSVDDIDALSGIGSFRGNDLLFPYEVDNSFRQRNSSSNHIKRVRMRLKTLKCPECDRYFGQKSHLNNHILSIHDQTKPYPCSECESKFSRKDVLINHILSIHRKDKQFKCSECDYACILKCRLALHIRTIHRKVKPFKCLECDKSFSMNSILTKHILTVHSKDKQFKCSQCDFSCNEKYFLKRHFQSVHEKLKPFECECGRSFGQKTSLRKHMLSVHEKKSLYKCNECDVSFNRKFGLKYHSTIVHKK